MDSIRKEITDLTTKSIKLREAARDLPFEKAIEIRKEQTKIYKKRNFLIGYLGAANKIKHKEDKNNIKKESNK